MLDQFRLFLGPARTRALFLLLAVTGLVSLILNALAIESTWRVAAQSSMVIIFLVGAGIIVGGRMGRGQRLRWLAILVPFVGLVLLALTVLPHLVLPLMGAAAGWVIAGLFIFRPRLPRAYQDAIKHMRKGDYDEAVNSAGELIKEDAENPDYYRLRAEIFRLWGKLDRALKDYQAMVDLTPESAVGYNGLAEVYLQSGKFAEAREAGLAAYRLAPDEWVATYNLGMIEDRLHDSAGAIEHLQAALQHKIPDARHRLLIHLYLLRAYQRAGNTEAANTQLEALKRQRSGLEEWQNILQYEQAAPLKVVLADDVELAQSLVDGEINLESVG